MSDSPIFWRSGEDAAIQQAITLARQTFKYFWREIYWENRRIVPALSLAAVKIIWAEQNENEEEMVEHLWLNDIYFDGINIYGKLINQPHALQNIQAGDNLSITLEQLSDWLFVCQDKTYGGFTIQAIRHSMNEAERQEHDAAWGLNFGDSQHIAIAYEADIAPENLIEHPMSRNMREKLAQELQKQPQYAQQSDEQGYTLLHHSAIAGNLTEIEALIAAGANPQAQTATGKTALDFAKQMGWEHIVEYLHLQES